LGKGLPQIAKERDSCCLTTRNVLTSDVFIMTLEKSVIK
jgi:hypothetical protein